MLRNYMTAASIVLTLFLAQSSIALHAQPSASTQTQRSATLADIQASIVRVVGTGFPANDLVEVTAPGSILSVSRINSNMNTATHGERNTEANIIASIVSKAISGRAEFKNLIAIHVRYVIRSARGTDKLIDTVEFRKDPNGEFPYHGT